MMKLLGVPLVLAIDSCSPGPGSFTPKTKVERLMIGILEKFDRWDLNGDGKLVASELGDAGKRSDRTPAEILDFYDADRDGGITLREAQGGLSRTDEAERRAKQ